MPSIYNNNLIPTLWGAQGNTNPIGSAANASNVPGAGGNANTIQFNNSGALDGVPFATYSNGNLILGDVSTLKITGAQPAEYLTTDGTGNLFWANIQGNTIPRYDWNVVVTGNGQTFTNANIAKYSSNAFGTVFRNGVLVDTSNFTMSGPDIIFNVPLTAGDKMSLISAATGGPGFAAGATFDVQYNNSAALFGDNKFTYNDVTEVLGVPNVVVTSSVLVGQKLTAANIDMAGTFNAGNITAIGEVHLGPVTNVHITGGTNGFVLSTDGSGNLGWVAQTGGGGTGSPGGANTQVQFNDGGLFGGESTFTYNKDTNTLAASNIVGNGSGLTALPAANIVGTVANAAFATLSATANTVAGANVTGQVQFAGTANAVAGANVTGQVAFAGTANAVAGANVTGAVGFATVANSVAGANVTGAVSFAAIANSVAGANVVGAVANAAFATTAGTVVSVPGANVTGQVLYAAIANSVAGANVTGTILYALNANAANFVTGNVQSSINTLGPLTGLTVNGFTSLGSNANVFIQGGAPGTVLTTNGSGNLYWGAAGGGGGGTPGGAFGQLQYNNLGTFAGVPNVSFAAGNLSLGPVANVKLNGGTSGQVLSTDGAGNLAWVTGSGGGGSGTVTSVGLTAGTGMSVSGGPVTSFGNITVTNTGVTSLVAGANIGVSAANGAVTVTNEGIRNILPGSTNVTVSIVNGVAVIDSNPPTSGGTVTSVAMTPGAGIGIVGGPVTSTGTFTVTNTGVTRLTAGAGVGLDAQVGNVIITNNGVQSLTAGTGIAVSSGNGNVTVTNDGVTSATAGAGIGLSGNTGVVTFTNTGVTAISAGNNVTLSSTTGNVTINAQVSSITNINYASENVALITAQTGTYNYNLVDGTVQYAQSAATANVALNFRGNSTTTMNALILAGQSITASYIMTTGGTGYGITAVSIDGASQPIRWVSGNLPSQPPNSIMSYTFTLVKIGAASYTVLGSATRYA